MKRETIDKVQFEEFRHKHKTKHQY